MNESHNSTYTDFLWYEVGSWETLEQGDMLPDCPVIVPPPNITNILLESTKGNIIQSPSQIQTFDLIILSQSCDLAHDKITQVLLCAYFSADELSKSNRVSIRKEQRPAHHMLEQCEIEGHKFSQRVVDFRTIYTLPKDFVLEYARCLGKRVRLLPPYKEHLAQAFARYFMRVGLPRPLKEL
jgi:hypothetical protein